MDATALYRDTFAVVVNTCGPASPAPAPAATPESLPQSSPLAVPRAVPIDRAACHDLAIALNDIIEDDKMNTADFVKARGAFAQSCAPR